MWLSELMSPMGPTRRGWFVGCGPFSLSDELGRKSPRMSGALFQGRPDVCCGGGKLSKDSGLLVSRATPPVHEGHGTPCVSPPISANWQNLYPTK